MTQSCWLYVKDPSRSRTQTFAHWTLRNQDPENKGCIETDFTLTKRIPKKMDKRETLGSSILPVKK